MKYSSPQSPAVRTLKPASASWNDDPSWLTADEEKAKLDTLEAMINAQGLATIVADLAEICYWREAAVSEKEHSRAKARAWKYAGDAIMRAALGVDTGVVG